MHMRPIPNAKFVMNAAAEASKTLDAIMQPASSDQIAIELKKLSLHCGKGKKTEQENKFIYIDYCLDLAEYPIKLIADACETYRKLPEGNSFMPTSGKLISLMALKWTKMKFLRTRINKILRKEEIKPISRLSIDQILENFL